MPPDPLLEPCVKNARADWDGRPTFLNSIRSRVAKPHIMQYEDELRDVSYNANRAS